MILLGVLLGISEFVDASGYFEIKLVSYANHKGELADGSCCDNKARDHAMTSRGENSQDRNVNTRSDCSGNCEIYFKFCLKEYQLRISFEGVCTFGNTTSVNYIGNYIEFGDKDTSMVLPFDFAWTVGIGIL